MKVVKLNNRYTAYKLGFTHALRFDSWGNHAGKAEEILFKMYNTPCHYKPGAYYGHFGRAGKNLLGNSLREKPYWINLRYETDITLLLLNGVANENTD